MTRGVPGVTGAVPRWTVLEATATASSSVTIDRAQKLDKRDCSWDG